MDEREKRLGEKVGFTVVDAPDMRGYEANDANVGLPEETEMIVLLWRECLRLMAQQEWVKVSPETMPEPHTSWLIAWHNYGTGNIVEEAYWNGEHWCLTRTNPCDEPIYLDEQVYAYTKIPDAPGLPTEGGKE